MGLALLFLFGGQKERKGDREDAPTHNLHSNNSHPQRPPLSPSLLLPTNDPNEQHQKHLRLRLQLPTKLLQQQKDDARRAECEGEYGSLGEGFEEEGREVVAEEEEKFLVLRFLLLLLL
jgi:hypothetical protein